MKKILSVLLSFLLLSSIIPITKLNVEAVENYETESNNDYSSADTLTLNNFMYGKMDSTSDIDVYKITTSNNGKISLSFKHKYLSSSAYWKVAIYQFSGGKYNELSLIDIYGNGDETINLPSIGATSGGVYYVKVYMSASFYDLVDVEYTLTNTFNSTEYYEKEVNGSYDSATNMSLNQTYTGCMNSISDVDIYKITTSGNGKISLSFKHKYLSSSAYWKVAIYQFSGGKYNELSLIDIYGNGDETINLPSIGATSGGVYYIKVYMSASYYALVGVEYSLTNTFGSTEYYEKEVNDSYDSATNMSLNQTYTGCMNSTSDVDVYKITTTGNGKASLSFKHKYLSGSAYWKVAIYQFSGGKYNELSLIDIYGNGDETINLPSIGATSGGVYYIKVYMSASYYALVGVEYSLTNTFGSTEYYEKEVDDSYDSATNMSLNQTYTGCMNSTSDVDVYKITTSGAGKLSLSFKHKYLSGSAYWKVAIYQFSSGKYNELSLTDIYCSGDEIIDLPDIETISDGVYYVKVYLSASFYDLVGLDYSISIGVNDTTKPTGSISSTNNVATSQTVTLKLSDNIGVDGFYWGTSSTYSNNTYTSTSSSTVKRTVSSAGTYYLVVKDTSGNLSTAYSVTFYKTTLNANGGSVSPSYVITKSGNSVTLPTPSKSNATFLGWGTSSTSTSGVKSVTPTSNKTYYAVWEEISTVTLGDINGDGAVDAGDAVIISRYDAGLITLTTDQLKAGDVNGDGTVDAGDAVIISRYDAGLISSLN